MSQEANIVGEEYGHEEEKGPSRRTTPGKLVGDGDEGSLPPQLGFLSTPGQPEPAGVMTFSGAICQLPVRILIDLGASDNFLSSAFAAKAGVPTIPTNHPPIQLADGNTSDASRSVENIHLGLGHRRIALDCVVTQLHHYDLILGAPWFRCHAPVIMDHAARTCRFQLANREITLWADDYVDPSGNPTLTAMQTRCNTHGRVEACVPHSHAISEVWA